MPYTENADILSAIRDVTQWAEIEGTPVKPAAIAREIVKIGRTFRGTEQSARLAAFGLLAGGLEINVGNIAWLIRDGSIGFPDQPTFEW